ncbi:isoprenylcysteine carboxyl methyltransferase [Fusarium sp. NRRL 25303]|nr:isoprenylcysteine carboxyl methyltransferase [Fusarium sp. NRRL 25303]
MALQFSLSQASLAAAILGSTHGTYLALSPPNPSEHSAPSTGDSVRWLFLTRKHTTKVILAPLGLLSLHTASLALRYPNIPPSLVHHGIENGLNPDLITWSAATTIPLALILCAGVPLRLVPYASLGKNFTFALKEPDRLKTTGIYQYLQHPSYTGLAILMIFNVALLGRLDGVLSCWIPPSVYETFCSWAIRLLPFTISGIMFGIWTRVSEEEKMLKRAFGKEWESWHARTARFIPFIF